VRRQAADLRSTLRFATSTTTTSAGKRHALAASGSSSSVHERDLACRSIHHMLPTSEPEVTRVQRKGAGLPDGAVSDPRADNSPPPAATRITVSLVAKAAADLARTLTRTRLSQTDIVNRALSLYEFFDSEISSGAEVIVRRDGQDHHVVLL
jgi:hypothetical protein